MTKRGRKPKPGERYKCGKRTRSARADDIVSTAVFARMRQYNVSWDVAKSDAMGSPLGRLRHHRIISEAQADAGYDFALTLRTYISTAKLNRGVQTKANFVPVEPDNGDGPPVKGESKAKAYMEALAEIDRSDPFSSPTVTAVIWKVCYDEEDWPGQTGALRIGLNAIHRILYGRKAA